MASLGTGTAFAAAAGGFASGVISGGSLRSGLFGAFSATLFFGIGETFASVEGGAGVFGTGLEAGDFGAKVLAHGIAGGVMAGLQGGNFGHGFVSAGVTQAFSGQIDRIPGKGVSGARVAVAAAVGGTASVLSGGKFANGAITGAFSRAFNDELHEPATQSEQQISPSVETKIELVYTNAYRNEKHAFLVVTDSEGNVWGIRAGPSDRRGGDISSAVSEANAPSFSGSSGGSFGRILVESGNQLELHDFRGKVFARQKILVLNESSRRVIDHHESFGGAVNAAGINYNPFVLNSNSFAFDAAESLGVPRPIPPNGISAPAHQFRLPVEHEKFER